MQGLRGRSRRRGLVRGRRHVAGGTALGRSAVGASGVGRRARFGGQSGWGVERVDGAERSVAAAGGARGPGERRVVGGRCRRGRGSRHRDDAGRSDRGPGAAGQLRAGPGRATLAGVDQVEHGPHAGRRGRRRGDQDGAGDAPRDGAGHAACRRAQPARGLDGRVGAAGDRGAALAGQRSRPTGRRVVLRHQRHQCARDCGGGAAPRNC